MKPVTWRARRSCPSSRWPKTLSAVGQAIRREIRVTCVRPRKSTAPAPGEGGEQQGGPEPVPEGEVVRVGVGRERVGVRAEQPVRPSDAGPEDQAEDGEQGGRREEGPPDAVHGGVGEAGLAGEGAPDEPQGVRVVSADPATTAASAHRSAVVPCSSASNAASFAAKPSSGGRAAMEAAASTATAATYGRERPTPESLRRSRVPVAWSTMPVTRKSGALKRAWPRIIATAARAAFRLPVPASRVRKPSWLTVP